MSLLKQTPVVGILLLACGLLASPAEAVPGFARKYDVSCSQCHNPFPNLNRFGRTFKENGYRLDPGPEAPEHLKETTRGLWQEATSYTSAKLNGRIYDKSNTQDEFRLRTFHELELFLAGSASNNWSFNVVAEAEDEEDFNLFIDWAAVGWHPKKEVNFVGGYGPIFYVDPYNTLSDGSRRLTRSHKAPLDKGFASGFTLDKSTQFASFYGRKDDFFYSVSIGTGNDDPEGKDEKDIALRAAYDFSSISVGAFYVDGSTGGALGNGRDRNWSKTGVDFQVEAGSFSVYGLWMEDEGDVLANGLGFTESSTSGYLEAMYLREKNGEIHFVPIIRYEEFESNDGRASTAALATVLSFFLRPNINLNLEWWQEISVPGSRSENDRVTLFFNVGV